MKSVADLKREIEKTDRELDRLNTQRIALAWELKQREAGRSYGHRSLHYFAGAIQN